MARSLGIVGVPTSAGAFAPGQERAPAALREAGLVEALAAHGVATHDHGERRSWRWRPDAAHPRAQNLDMVVEIVRHTADRVAALAADGEVALVLGGDCTVGVGTVAGLAATGPVGLVYLDAHADLNVPAAVPEGALDWMGLAHMLDEEGTEAALAGAGPRRPLLEPARVALLGWDAVQATPVERAAIARLGLAVVDAPAVAADPVAAATAALAAIAPGVPRIAVHFDVDAIDFTDAPLSENPGRNEGLPYVAVLAALRTLLASSRVVALTVTELNPDHAAAVPGLLERFTGDLAEAVAGMGALAAA